MGIMENKITELFTNSGMSIREFSDKTNIKYNTARDIVNGTTRIENIGAGAFVRIAHVFNMTADELLGIVDVKGNEATDEQKIIDLYRSMTDSQRSALLAIAHEMVR